jgi:arginyl-tRNA synthetase
VLLKIQLQQLIQQALEALQQQQQFSVGALPEIKIERTRERGHGDFACNIAMVLAKQAKRKPRELAQLIVDHLPQNAHIRQVDIAGPGFINFFLTPAAYYQILGDILQQGASYGRSQAGNHLRVQVEFVSSNPTGPLHVGHGRGAAYGATLANLLEAVGFEIEREYYVNDAGRQIDILTTSVWLRYLALHGEQVAFPANGYKGDYVHAIAAQLDQQFAAALVVPAGEISAGLPADEAQGGDKEAHITALIERCKTLLGSERYRQMFDLALTAMVADMRNDLEEFGVVYDCWFSERSLIESGAVAAALEQLQAAGYLYEKDCAQWFRSTDFGDDKDRVVKRSNGQTTYFASDIAYVANKFGRGYDRMVYVWGADHHGTVPRLKAACQALGFDPARIDVPLVQFANLFRGGERVQMSTRAGEFVTLRELRAEVGNDAARFFYIMRKSDQHLDFDLDLAKSESKDNPVYYIQYAHARVCSMLNRLAQHGWHYDAQIASAALERLSEAHEQVLLSELSRYPEMLEAAALNYDPHLLANYLRELANAFHSYYNEHRMLIEDEDLRNARLQLSLAVRQVIRNGLELLGVSAPESM